jgi:hypothetical protein
MSIFLQVLVYPKLDITNLKVMSEFESVCHEDGTVRLSCTACCLECKAIYHANDGLIDCPSCGYQTSLYDLLMSNRKSYSVLAILCKSVGLPTPFDIPFIKMLYNQLKAAFIARESEFVALGLLYGLLVGAFTEKMLSGAEFNTAFSNVNKMGYTKIFFEDLPK